MTAVVDYSPESIFKSLVARAKQGGDSPLASRDSVQCKTTIRGYRYISVIEEEGERPHLNQERLRSNSGFTNVKPFKLMPIAREYVARFDSLNGRNWLYFVGPPGTGKTTQAESVALSLMYRNPRLFVREISFSASWRELCDVRRSSPREYPALFDRLVCAPMMIFDDFLATLPAFQDSAEAAMIEEMVDYRYRKRLPTILTTNRARPSVEKALPDRAGAILDRVYEMTNQGRQTVLFDDRSTNYRRVSQ